MGNQRNDKALKANHSSLDYDKWPTKVDGVSYDEAGLRSWRSRVCALPQRAALFAATLRDNLDPANKHTDADIYKALEQVTLCARRCN
ncbi:putative ATP-dependent bile acid permease [Operophtera brumata]|uniref:Putative ATP-dependent bile acid permease n=1 Tax=Operophtera brumata TaxID=104452 RepID=A0A0L7L6I5_OPEBR|nr:putative ATP-dependent bile acid permease [Operophtera brumata]